MQDLWNFVKLQPPKITHNFYFIFIYLVSKSAVLHIVADAYGFTQ
jgi:hypothetical protein